MKFNQYLKVIAITLGSYLLIVFTLVLLEYKKVIDIHITLNSQEEFQWNTFVIIGVLITALVALIGHIQNNERLNHKLVAENIAKARIEWLQNARNHFSTYLSLVNQARQLNIKYLNKTITQSEILELKNVNIQAEQSYYQLIFMINPKESIINELDSLLDYTSPNTALQNLINKTNLTDVSKHVQDYFHNEWVRTKKEIITGEVEESTIDEDLTTIQRSNTDSVLLTRANEKKEQDELTFLGILADQLTTSLTFIALISSIILANMTVDKQNTQTLLSHPGFAIPFTMSIGFFYGISLALKSTKLRWDTSNKNRQIPSHKSFKTVTLAILFVIWIYSIVVFMNHPEKASDLTIATVVVMGLWFFLLVGLMLGECIIYRYLNRKYRKHINS